MIRPRHNAFNENKHVKWHHNQRCANDTYYKNRHVWINFSNIFSLWYGHLILKLRRVLWLLLLQIWGTTKPCIAKTNLSTLFIYGFVWFQITLLSLSHSCSNMLTYVHFFFGVTLCKQSGTSSNEKFEKAMVMIIGH